MPLAPPALLIIFCTKESLRKDLFLPRRRSRVGVEIYPKKNGWSSLHHCVTFVFLVSYFLFSLFLVAFFLVSNFYCHRDIIPSPNYCSQGAADVIVNLGSTTTSYCFTKIISSIIIFRITINPKASRFGWDLSKSVLQLIECPPADWLRLHQGHQHLIFISNQPFFKQTCNALFKKT